MYKTSSKITHFRNTWSKDDIPKKPHPIAAINIAKSLNTPCEEIYFIGDTMVDMQTAKRCEYEINWCFMGF